MASRKIEDCDPILAEIWAKSVIQWKDKYPNRAQPFLTCTYRSNEEQTALYMNNKDGKDNDGDGLVDEKDVWRTNAKAGQSKHNLSPSKALDIAFKDADKKLNWSEGLFKDFAVIMKDNGAMWGGDWHSVKDTPHFEI